MGASVTLNCCDGGSCALSLFFNFVFFKARCVFQNRIITVVILKNKNNLQGNLHLGRDQRVPTYSAWFYNMMLSNRMNSVSTVAICG